MKYAIDSIQYSGIAIFAGSVISQHNQVAGALAGIWLLIFGYLLTLLQAELKK